MLTILANMIFWPAIAWNFILWAAMAFSGIKPKTEDWLVVIISFMVLCVPGVYLFGIF